MGGVDAADEHSFIFDEERPGHRLTARNLGLNANDLLAVELRCSCGGFQDGFTFDPVTQDNNPRYVEMNAVVALEAFRLHAAA